jgi:hypothetical protein
MSKKYKFGKSKRIDGFKVIKYGILLRERAIDTGKVRG